MISQWLHLFRMLIGPMYIGGGEPEQQTVSTPTNTTSTTKSAPWGPQAPHLKRVFSAAQRQFQGGGPKYFQGQNYIDPSKQTLGAVDAMTRMANRGLENQYGARAVDQAQQTAIGMMNPERSMSQFMSGWGNDVRDSINNQFAKAGAGFGSGHARALGSGLGEAAARYDDAIQNRALQAAGMAPTLAGLDYADSQRLAQAGRTMEGYAGDKLRAQMERFNFNQNRPVEALARYGSMVSGNYGGTSSTRGSSTTQQTYYTNPMGNAIGLAGVGAGIGGAFGGIGAGIGGLGGLLLGGLL